jgi:hypothetical protein
MMHSVVVTIYLNTLHVYCKWLEINIRTIAIKFQGFTKRVVQLMVLFLGIYRV